MGTYYVRTTGNDTTGDGSTGAPWLTLSKALATVSIAGGHTILMGDGTYQENSSGLGYLLVQRAFAAYVTVQPENGESGIVTLSGTSSATYSLRFDGCTYIRLKWMTIATATPLTSAYGLIAITGSTTHHFEFIGLTMVVASRADSLAWGIIIENSVAGRVYQDFLFEDLTITQSGSNGATGLRFDGVEGAPIERVTIRDCTITISKYAIFAFNNVIDVVVDGGTYSATGTDGMGICLGLNGQSGLEVTGSVSDAFVSSAVGHALLVGAGCDDVEIARCWIEGGDQGLVVKQCDGAIIHDNNIIGATINALYFKAATNATAYSNLIVNRAGTVVKIGYDSADSAKCENVNFQHNFLFAGGAAVILDWGDDTDDAGGGICNYNYYQLLGQGVTASIRSDIGLTDMAGIRAAWDGYDVSGNDGNSMYGYVYPRRAYWLRG